MNQFKQYLFGREFLVRTDRAALTWFQKTPEVMGQQARWQKRLLEFFKIQHHPEVKHWKADALSRRPCSHQGAAYRLKATGRWANSLSLIGVTTDEEESTPGWRETENAVNVQASEGALNIGNGQEAFLETTWEPPDVWSTAKSAATWNDIMAEVWYGEDGRPEGRS